MSTPQDCSIGLSPAEASYGTNTTVTRWIEFIGETLDFRKNLVQGQGLHAGSRVPRAERRVVASADAGGDITVECCTKGMGLYWQANLGVGVSNLISGSAYQQMFTIGDTASSVTVQKGLVNDAGTVDAYTFVGGMVDSWEFTFAQSGIATLKSTWDFKDVTTATAYATPSYVASTSLYHFAQATLSTGTFTAPTTTTIASAATPVANVRSGTISCSNNVDGNRYLIGGAGRKAKPIVGTRMPSGTLEVEYSGTLFRDAIINDTAMSLVLTFTSTDALSTGFATLQVALPAVKCDGELPKSNAGDLITHPVNFQVLDNLVATQPIWVVMRTADTTL